MGIPIWCFLAPLFLDTVGGSLHDNVAESYYETPQSSSPAPQPTQPTPPELIGMKEIVLYLTPDQVETLQAAGAVVQPYSEYENDFDELQEPFRVNTPPQNDQQYQNWINPLESQKDNSELQQYYKFLNIQEINDDLTPKTQAPESTTEPATTTPRYKLSKTRQQYKEKELTTKKPSRTKMSNQSNNVEYVRFLPDYEHEILQIIPYRPLPLAPYQYEDIIYTQENLEAQQNAYSEPNTTPQQNTFIQVDTERQTNAYSQETIGGTRNVYSQANVAPQNAVTQVNTETQRNVYPLIHTVTQQNANVQPNEYSQKTTEVQQNAYSQANVVVQQNVLTQVNKEAQRNLQNLPNNVTQQNAFSQASIVPQQNGFNRITTEAQLNAYFPETTEEQRNKYFQVNAAVKQNALTQLNTEAQRNVPTPANIVIEYNGFTPANTVPQQNTYELDNAKTQLNAYFQGTTERQRNEYFQENAAAQQKAFVQVNAKAQQNIFPKTTEVKQNAYSQENTARKNDGYSYKTIEEQQNTFREKNTEATQNVYTPANTVAPKTAYTIAYTEAPQYKLFQDVTVTQRNAFSQANIEAQKNAYTQETAVPQQTAKTVETTEASQNIYSQAKTVAPQTTSTVRNTKAQQNGHSRGNKGNQRNVLRRPRPSRIRQKETKQRKEPEKIPVPVLIEKPSKQKTYLKSQNTEEFKETLTSIEGLPPLPPLELPLEKPVTPAPPAPTVKTRLLQQDRFSLLLAPLYQHQTITESISRQKEELLRNEFNIRTKLKQMKESPGYYDQREYIAELEKLTRNFGQQNALARIEARTDSENPTVFVNQGPGTTENLVKSTELPMLVRMPKPHDAKLLAPSSVPVEFTQRRVPTPVVERKRPIEASRNVYVRVQNPYTIQKFTPFTERQNIPVLIPINPEQITIMRHIWEH